MRACDAVRRAQAAPYHYLPALRHRLLLPCRPPEEAGEQQASPGGKKSPRASSQYRGVTRDTRNGAWRSQLWTSGKVCRACDGSFLAASCDALDVHHAAR